MSAGEAISLSVAPNPSAGESRVRVVLAQDQQARVALYDALGREVAVLFAGEGEAGRAIERALPGGLSAGVYLVRVETQASVRTQRVVVLR